MEYTEDQLSGWIDALEQNPSYKGVYHVKVLHTEFENDYSFFDGDKWLSISGGIKDAAKRKDPTLCDIESWRGLSSDPSAPKKRAGNKRKPMYVVMAANRFGSYRGACGVFEKKENAQEYAEYLDFEVRIQKIRFRTPEA